MKASSSGRDALLRLMLFAALAGALGGCAVGPAAWDRDIMAQRAMKMDTEPVLTAANEHIYFSKEGSSGGRTSDGGGCGCN